MTGNVQSVSFAYQAKNNSKKIKNEKKEILKNLFNAKDDIENLKENCKFIFSDKKNSIKINDEAIEKNSNKSSLQTICTQRNYFSSERSFTKSMIDYAIIVFFKDILETNNDNKFKKLIEIFSNPNNFKNAFNKFLKSLGVENNIYNINNIPKNYLSIQYLGNISKIKLNTIDLDLKGYNFKTINNCKSVKNKVFRELHQDEIKDLKIKSFNYFVEKIKTIDTTDINIEKNKKEAEKILKLAFFLKATNLILRKFTNCRFNFNDFNELANPLFNLLDIKDDNEKFDFLNHAFMLNFHRNVGLYCKRSGQILLIAATAAALCITVFGAIYIAREWYLTIIGAAVEGAHDFEGVGKDMIFERLGMNFQAGDRIHSYTKGMTNIFDQLSIKYNQLDNINLSEKLPSNDQLDELLNSNISKEEKLNCLKNIMNKLFDEGSTIRNGDLNLIDIK